MRLPVLCVTVALALPGDAAGSSLRFFGNGTGQIDRVKVPVDNPHRPADVGGDFTVEFWMKGAAAENTGNVMAQTNGDGWITGNVIIDRDIFGSGDHGDWGIAVGASGTNTGRIAFGVDRSGTGRTIVAGSGQVLDNAWHHVAVTRHSSTGLLQVYVDGVRRATNNGPTGDLSYRDGRSTSWPQSDPFLVFGAEKHDAADFYGGSYPSFGGWLDEVRISSVVRYTGASFALPPAPFVPDADTAALWSFDEGSGDHIGDRSTASGGPSHGTRAFGGAPQAGPLWSTDTPFAAVALVDFGWTNFPSPTPDARGNHWNNLQTSISNAPVGTLSNLVNTAGLPTGFSVSVANFGAGANTNGTTVPDEATLGRLATPAATRDGFFVAEGQTATITLAGLAPAGLYRLTFFGSRAAPEVRTTRFSAQGAGSPVEATVQTSGAAMGAAPETDANRSFTAVLDNLRPAASGQVVVFVTAASGSFGYAGAWMVERTGSATNNPPVASAVQWAGAPREGAGLTGSFTYFDVDGDPQAGSTFVWERSPSSGSPGTPIAGATNTSYVPGPADEGNYLRFVVTPGAATGTSPGEAAASALRGPVAAAGAASVFHVGNSFTRWGDVPAQLASFASATGQPHVRGDQLRDGEGLGWHWTNGLPGGDFTRGTPARTELDTATWDSLVLQPMSREFLPENQPSFLAHADLFDDLCDARGTQLFLYTYWPYLGESLTVQDAINTAFESVRSELSSDGPPVRVIPAGEAFRRVALEAGSGPLAGLSRADLYQDDLHPSSIGYYLSSLVHYATIYARSPAGLPASGINADPGNSDAAPIDPVVAAELQRIVWDVVRSHPGTGVTRARFDEWAATHLPHGVRGPGDEPFADGIPNLLRWAHGIPAAPQADRPGLPAAAMLADGVRFRISYRRGTDAADAGAIVTEQWSTDLSSWDHPPPEGLVRTQDGETITLTFQGKAGPLFFRCRAVTP